MRVFLVKVFSFSLFQYFTPIDEFYNNSYTGFPSTTSPSRGSGHDKPKASKTPSSVLHKDIGFPYIVQMGIACPDLIAINEKGETKKIEIELFASHFDHDPKGCDYIVCWEKITKRNQQTILRS